MTTHRLSLLREEYETTSITIDELCLYHGVLLKELKGYKNWKKRADIEEVDVSHLLVSEVEPEVPAPSGVSALEEASAEPVIEEVPQASTPPITTTTQATTLPAVIDNDADIVEEIRADIKTCKRLAMARCKEFLINDAKFAEVKEIKDIVSIVNDIDKSMQVVKVADGPTVNVYINNLINNFRDDC